MSSRSSGLDQKFAIPARFPSEHIQAIGLGEVGSIFLTFAANGSIRKAEAELINAPYKRMLIDNPAILRIFGQRGDSIDTNVLHPSAKFRLDALKIKVDDDGDLDMTSFDVGRLVDITNMPESAHMAWPVPTDTEEGDVHRRVREALELDKGKKAKRGKFTPANDVAKDSVAKAKVDANKNAVPTTVLTSNPPTLPTPPARSTPSPPSTPPDEPPSMSKKRFGGRNKPIPGGPFGEQMKLVWDQIVKRLSKSDVATYTEYVTNGRKDAAKSEAKKATFHQELRAFVEQHDILALHNTYATAQHKSGSNKIYHLPVFDDNSGVDME
jgi:hypothetical protein